MVGQVQSQSACCVAIAFRIDNLVKIGLEKGVDTVADRNAGFWNAYQGRAVGLLSVDSSEVRDIHLCTDLSSRSRIRLVLVDSTVVSTWAGIRVG